MKVFSLALFLCLFCSSLYSQFNVEILNKTITNRCLGRIALSANGNAGPFTFTLKDQSGTILEEGPIGTDALMIPGLCDEIYTVEFFSNSGCDFSESFSLGSCDNIVSSTAIFPSNASSCNIADGSFRVSKILIPFEFTPLAREWWERDGVEVENFDSLYIGDDGVSDVVADSLFSGTYCYYAVGVNGCLGEACTTIGYDHAPEMLSSATSPACLNSSSGSIEILMDGDQRFPEDDYRFILYNDNGEALDTLYGYEALFINLPAGDYDVEVTWSEQEDCTLVESFTVGMFNPGTLSPLSAPNNVVQPCGQTSNGRISVSPQGGLSPYEISWTPSSSVDGDFTRTSLRQGNYSYTVTDRCGSSVTADIVLRGLITGISSEEGCESGSITAQALFGNAPYSYIWSNGETTPTIGNLQTGTYTVTITDALEHCKEVHSSTIQNSGVTISQIDPSCTGISLGEIVVNVNNPHRRRLTFTLNNQVIPLVEDPAMPGQFIIEGITPNEVIDLQVQVGSCLFSETIEMGELPLSEELNMFENDTCFFNQVCGDSIINVNGVFSGPDIAFLPTGNRSGVFSDCSRPLFCRGEEVGELRARLIRAPLPVYLDILDGAFARGFINSDEFDLLTASLPDRGLNNCNTLRFCPITLDHTGTTWLIDHHGQGEVDERGCIDFNCPFWSAQSDFNTCVAFETALQLTGIGDLFNTSTITPRDCDLLSLPARQLLFWRQDMISTFGALFINSTLNSHLQTLEDEMNDPNFTGDPLNACSKIFFCSNNFDFIRNTRNQVNCYEGSDFIFQRDTIIDGIRTTVFDTVFAVNTCDPVDIFTDTESWVCLSSTNRVNEVTINTVFNEDIFTRLVDPGGDDEQTTTVAIQGQGQGFELIEMPFIKSNGTISTKAIVKNSFGVKSYLDFTPYGMGSLITPSPGIEYYFEDYDNNTYFLFSRESLNQVSIEVRNEDNETATTYKISSDNVLNVDYSNLAQDQMLSIESSGSLQIDDNMIKSSTGKVNQLFLEFDQTGVLDIVSEIEVSAPSNVLAGSSSAGTNDPKYSGLSTGNSSIEFDNGGVFNLSSGDVFSISPQGKNIIKASLNADLAKVNLLTTTGTSKQRAAALIENKQPGFPSSGNKSLSLIIFDNQSTSSTSVSLQSGETHNNLLRELPNGNILFGCSFTGTLEVGDLSLPSEGNKDIFLGVFTPNGDLYKYETYGSVDNENIKELLFHNDQIYFGGDYSGSTESRTIGLLDYLQLEAGPTGQATSFTRPYLTHVGIGDLKEVKEKKSLSKTTVKEKDSQEVKVIPNPASETVTFDIPSSFKAKLLTIQNSLGETLKSVKASSEEGLAKRLALDISDLKPGIYFFLVESGQEKKTGKLVVK